MTKIILTHKHNDHSGEVRSFPNAKFYVNRIELETEEIRALKDHPGLTPVDFTDGPYYNFTRSQIIAPAVRMIPAPGHTYGNHLADGGARRAVCRPAPNTVSGATPRYRPFLSARSHSSADTTTRIISAGSSVPRPA